MRQLPADNYLTVSIYAVKSSKPFAWEAPPNRGSLEWPSPLWHSRAGGGAFHSIKSEILHRSKFKENKLHLPGPHLRINLHGRRLINIQHPNDTARQHRQR
jgi:hypothetical protein